MKENSYYEESDRGQTIPKKPDSIDEFTPKTQEHIKSESPLLIL